MGLFHHASHERNKMLQTILKQKRYHRLGTAGEGGIADVSSCFDTYLNRIVAIKKLKEESLDSPDLVRSFVNESKMVGYLDHPGVIPIYDTFVLEENRFSYSMKFIEGYSIAAELERHGKQPGTGHSLVDTVRIITRLSETMQYVHDKGVIHLDLKPDNIMLGSYGLVMVMDWGNARLYDDQPFKEYINAFGGDADVAQFQQERENIVLGTPGYMSPEQTNTARNTLTPASDIFSTGLVFYQMLTGAHPFEANDAGQIMENIRNRRQPPPHQHNPDIPRRLSAICQKMLEKCTADRYASFHQVLHDLREFSNSGQAFITRTYAPGDSIVKENEAGEFAFVIVSGSVEVSRMVDGKRTVLDELGEGEIVGELALFAHQPRTATVTATVPTAIRIMSRSDVESELGKLAPWVGNMISALSRRFTRLSQKLSAIQQVPDK